MAADESPRIKLSTTGGSLRSSSSHRFCSFGSNSEWSNGDDEDVDEENALLWAAIERLPTVKRLRSSVFREINDGNETDAKRKRIIDVTKLGDLERHAFIEELIKHIEFDNLRLLQKIRKRLEDSLISF